MAKKKQRLVRKPRPATKAATKSTSVDSEPPVDENDPSDDGDVGSTAEPESDADDVASEGGHSAEAEDQADVSEEPEPELEAEQEDEPELVEAEEAAPESQEMAMASGEEGDREAGAIDEAGLDDDFDGSGLMGEGLEVDESGVEDTEQFLKGLVEAILFCSDKPQSSRDVARAARIDKGRAQELIEQLVEETKTRGVRLVEVSEGYAFRTNPAYSAYVREYLAQRPVRLSRAQLETLAIVAYRQPLTRPEVDDIRGVDSGGVLKTLLERELVRILGKKDEPGRPIIYGTAPAFLDLFSLNSLRDLPTLREFTELSEDSRLKFEMEIGEPAPEGTIQFPDDETSGANDADAEPLAEVSEMGAEEGSEEASDQEADSAGDVPSEDDEDSAPLNEAEADDDVAATDVDEEKFPEDAPSENDEDSVPVNEADEEEFPDDEDDDEDEDEDDEDDDEEDED